MLYDALPAGPTPCALHTSSSMFAKHGFLFLLCSIPRSRLALIPETMLSSREAGWVDWFSSRTVLALGHIADLLSMVFFFWCTKITRGRLALKLETMLRTIATT